MPSLDQIDHIRLALLPTPLEPLPRLSRMLGGPEIWVKRDDCTGLGLGGNKARPLEYLVAEAIAEQADVLITTGGLQSNHARQTAAAAARCGLQCILVLINAVSGRDDAYGTSGNMLLDRLFGARIQIEPAGADAASAMAAAAEQCRAEGRRPYVIPSGGSNATGVIGHVRAQRTNCWPNATHKRSRAPRSWLQAAAAAHTRDWRSAWGCVGSLPP
jgi:L-cysteate sulfo-lyase